MSSRVDARTHSGGGSCSPAADGAPPSGRWIAFSELPGGRFYQAAYQGYSGDELRRAFGPDLAAYSQACQRLGGVPRAHGDAAFAFQALPRLALLAAAWQGDEDFPPSYAILFDASASHDYRPVLSFSSTDTWLHGY